MRIAWLTDIHLNFIDRTAFDELLVTFRDAAADAYIISGDIAEAHSVVDYLIALDDALRRPIYFVLGNHDYYYGSIADVRTRATDLCQQRPRLHYLTHASWHQLSDHTSILGHDGWADGREGDYMRSFVSMNDFRLIAELSGFNKVDRLRVLQQLGDEAAEHIRTYLPRALEQFGHVLLVTHVPPLRAACWHDGRISDDEWAPHFTCQALGNVLLTIMQKHPHKRLTVLCGHTHGCGETQPLPNVTIYTGGAEYGHPVVSRILEFP